MRGAPVIRTWLVPGLLGVLVGCGNGAVAEFPAPTGGSYEPDTVTAVLLEDGRFDGLVALMETAQVSQGPPGGEQVLGTAAEIATWPDWDHTVFAPTDEAFSALDQRTVDCMFEEENATQSVRIHLVQTLLSFSDFTTENVQTIGGLFRMEVADGEATFSGAEVIEADIDASNGVIHAVDGVNVPEGCTLDS